VLVALSALARLPKVVVAFVLVLLFRKPLPKAPPMVAAVVDDVVEDNGDAAATLLDAPVSNADLPPIELTDPKVAAADGVVVLVVPAAALVLVFASLARLPKPPVVVVVFPKPPL
jgi:hypothetical protein